jgi:hypothetical protein
MNTNMTPSTIAAIKAELSTVTPLADQFRAMQAAVAREEELLYVLAQLRAKQAEADRAAAQLSANVGRFSSISIKGTGKGNPLMDDYTVSYLEVGADVLTMEPTTRQGAQSLTGPTPELYAAILAQPDCLPAAIRALDDNPDAAVRMYCAGKRRGYLTI